jgi:hypothetical protein
MGAVMVVAAVTSPVLKESPARREKSQKPVTSGQEAPKKTLAHLMPEPLLHVPPFTEVVRLETAAVLTMTQPAAARFAVLHGVETIMLVRSFMVGIHTPDSLQPIVRVTESINGITT